MVGCIMVGCIMVGCIMVECIKEGGRRGESGGYVTRHCDFQTDTEIFKRTQKFSNGHRDFQTDTGISPANFIILKALGSDKSSVKFESLICVPPYYLNRK